MLCTFQPWRDCPVRYSTDWAMILITAGVMMIANRTGMKNMIIGTVSFGGSEAAFLSASVMRMDRCSFAKTRSAGPTGVPYFSACTRQVATPLTSKANYKRWAKRRN
jgi:hypothetical protein